MNMFLCRTLQPDLKTTMLLLFFLSCVYAADITTLIQQNDYSIEHHRLELISYNHNYFTNVKAVLVPLNRTSRAFNVSCDLLIDFAKESIPIAIQPYKKSMGDYRMFPVHLNEDYCKMRRNNSFGINDAAKHSNAPPCPINKGHYYLKSYRPDESKFPPHVVPGDYKLVAKVMYNSELIAEVHWYGSVKPTEKLQN